MQVRAAVVGTGFARTALLPAFQVLAERAKVVGIASARIARAESTAAEYRIPYAYDDWTTLIDDLRPDLVCVATPTWLHAPISNTALRLGAHVVCEKPMALNRQEAFEMLTNAVTAERHGIIDHELRFNPNYQRARELIADGTLGEILYVRISNTTSSWQDPKARPKNDWSSDASRGGGRLGANGSHQIDTLRWWLGPVDWVQGHLATTLPNRIDARTGEPWQATADDIAAFTLGMTSGTTAHVFISSVASHRLGNHVEVVGCDGTLVLSHDDGGRLLVGSTGHELEDISLRNPDASLPGIDTSIWPASTVSLLREVVEGIAEGRPIQNAATFEDGFQTQAVIDAVHESSVSGTRQRLSNFTLKS